MPYKEVKVYSDGNHFIGIPHTTRKVRKSITKIEGEELNPEECSSIEGTELPLEETLNEKTDNQTNVDGELETVADDSRGDNSEPVKNELKLTRKELFERLYDETKSLSKAQREKTIIAEMRTRFNTYEATRNYVECNLERKFRNLVCRRIRMVRKANLHLNEFNYFVTFTYDSSKLDETSFRKKLMNCLSLFSSRKGWRYIGVWERSPEKHRLHFHGIFIIPKGTMPGELVDVNDYSLKSHKRQTTHQNTYFLKNFGRNDFEEIESKLMMGSALAYLMKYLEKTGEKIVYSRGLPQFFITDITDDDVVCEMGDDEYKKLLLFDNFICWDEGEYVGRVSPETISKLRKSN